MAITFTIDETYTGFRTVTTPPAEPGGELGSEQVSTNKVSVTFTDGTTSHTRDVVVCLDENGDYDEAAMLLRCEEVALGVERKISVGAIG